MVSKEGFYELKKNMVLQKAAQNQSSESLLDSNNLHVLLKGEDFNHKPSHSLSDLSSTILNDQLIVANQQSRILQNLQMELDESNNDIEMLQEQSYHIKQRIEDISTLQNENESSGMCSFDGKKKFLTPLDQQTLKFLYNKKMKF